MIENGYTTLGDIAVLTLYLGQFAKLSKALQKSTNAIRTSWTRCRRSKRIKWRQSGIVEKCCRSILPWVPLAIITYVLHLIDDSVYSRTIDMNCICCICILNQFSLHCLTPLRAKKPRSLLSPLFAMRTFKMTRPAVASDQRVSVACSARYVHYRERRSPVTGTACGSRSSTSCGTTTGMCQNHPDTQNVIVILRLSPHKEDTICPVLKLRTWAMCDRISLNVIGPIPIYIRNANTPARNDAVTRAVHAR
ncbi:hypothetical protein BC938DRAFT_478575 [Jimgerdemannia flammicorona]|uniref:Uncharacterized protein n=1 Tax=Jimgerdemannia flammicorona TaxID=994334 RepID=A0A433QMP2_9FUNG|nr:hypothetical protein BC938DRAFT_478575 [Jimgerdemannia flammicorona]